MSCHCELLSLHITPFIFVGPSRVFFWDIPFTPLIARATWIDESLKGPFTPADDIDPDNRPEIPSETDLYPKRSQRVSLTAECRMCYLDNNIQYEKIKADLKLFNRIPNKTPMDGDCLFAAVLQQISHPREYTAHMLRKQTAYFATKKPEDFYEHIQSMFSKENNFYNYVMNLYEGRTYGDVATLAIIGVMWNLAISIVTPHLPVIHLFHDKPDSPEVIVIHNGRTGNQGHYTSTGMFTNFFVTPFHNAYFSSYKF